MSVLKVEFDHFMELAGQLPVIDVRSPSEYLSGHIPGSFNIPLFDDRQREIVGTKYKKEGRLPAIIEGLKLTGPSMADKLKKALDISKDGKLLVHCWRGGMRSESMAWLFSQGDIESSVLEGGYKNFRHHILESLCESRKMIILGGMTGSSKTHILRQLKICGEQVIDLEKIANHKGSAFGSLGQPPQPTTEQFANLLFDEWKNLKAGQPLWLEDESRNIGSVFMPDQFYFNMQNSHAIVLMMDVKTRLPRLLEEYSEFPADLLKAAVMKISKRLGGDDTKEALMAIETGDLAKAMELTLRYYDKTYMFSLKKKSEANITYIEANTNDIEANTALVLEAAGRIEWKL